MKRIYVPGGMREYVAITVSQLWELTSVSMCYSQGDGFNTSLSGLGYYNCTLPTVSVCFVVVYKRPCVCLLRVVMFGGTVMCYTGRR